MGYSTPLKLPSEISQEVFLFYYKEIHSGQKDHRIQLRKKARSDLESYGFLTEDMETLDDLSQPPRFSNGSISLSHSPSGSAMIASKVHRSVGVDIEARSRLSDALIKRVSIEAELLQCPESFDLFTAKEASWKALNHFHDLPTVSHIETHLWSQVAPKQFEYYVKNSTGKLPGRGFEFEFTDVYLSFFLNP